LIRTFCPDISIFRCAINAFLFLFSLERDAKLSNLEERADALEDGSKQFETRAASMKNKFFMENLKSMIMMGVVGLILAAVVYFKVC
jgi:vesicle-associated membrane protein 2